MRLSLFVFAVAILTPAISAAETVKPENAKTESVKPEAWKPWAIAGDAFKKDKKRLGVSGFACAPAGSGLCLLATDEGREAAFVHLTEGKLDYIRQVDLRGDGEADAEGVATDGTYFYVVGSHAVKRKSCDSNAASREVYRIEQSGDAKAKFARAKYPLWRVLQGFPALAPHAVEGACLGSAAPVEAPQKKGLKGVNIEGVAAVGGRLFFGFRGPSFCGSAIIVSVDAKALFEGDAANLSPALFNVDVGEKRGLRDLAVLGGEIYALAGPDDDNARVDYSVIELKGLAGGAKPAPHELARLDLSGTKDLEEKDEEGVKQPLKPEALYFIPSASTKLRALVLSDQGMDGAPLVFDIPR